MGCPNFGHFKDGGVDTISLLTMITHISTLDPEPWDGVSRLPQIALAVVDGPRTEPAGEAGGRRQLQENLSRMVDKGTVPPLGGFSGAPLVVIGSDGEFLIGIVVEGDYVFTAARVIAIAWDDIMNTFGRRTI
jgi:hypothetical protein